MVFLHSYLVTGVLEIKKLHRQQVLMQYPETPKSECGRKRCLGELNVANIPDGLQSEYERND